MSPKWFLEFERNLLEIDLKFSVSTFLRYGWVISSLFVFGFTLASAVTMNDSINPLLQRYSEPVKSMQELMDTSAVNGKNTGAASPDSVPAKVINSDINITNKFTQEKGIIVSSEDGKPVAGATLILKAANSKYTSQSDNDGLYVLANIDPAIYQLKVSKSGYALYELNEVVISKGQNSFREIHLEKRILKGQLIEAKSSRNSGSAASMQAIRRSSAGVMEGIGAEQISKSTDGDAGAVAKRITGTSLVGGKYVYVRGLGERYTNMTLNGLPVPSPEKDKRVVPQDLFPSTILESFAIHKTFSPELYSDFAGGSVSLVTRGIPEKTFLKISIGTGGTDFSGDGKFLNWGDNRLTYSGGNTYWGFDDGTRSLPKNFPNSIPGISDKDVPEYHAKGLAGYTTKERLQFALQLPNIYSVDTAKITPYQNFSVTWGNVSSKNENSRFGYLASAAFKNKYVQKDIHKVSLVTVATGYDSTYIHPIIGPVTFHVIPTDTMPGFTGDSLDGKPVPNTRQLQKLDTGISANISSGIYEAVLSGMLNLGYENRDHAFFWKNFFVNIGTDETSRNHSRAFPGGRQDNPVEEGYLLNFNQRSLLSSQMGGGHYLGLGPLDSVAWAGGYSKSQGTTPDSRRYKYSGETDTTVNSYANNDIWGTRIFETLNENNFSFRSDAFLILPPEIFKKDTLLSEGTFFSKLHLPTAQTGLFVTQRSRDFAATRFQYGAVQQIQINQTLEQIRDPKRLTLDILDPTHPQDFYSAPKNYDEYSANERTMGAYFSGNIGFSLWNFPLNFVKV